MFFDRVQAKCAYFILTSFHLSLQTSNFLKTRKKENLFKLFPYQFNILLILAVKFIFTAIAISI